MARAAAVPIQAAAQHLVAREASIELARAQGLPATYDLTDEGRLSKTATIRLIGNSVCPGVADAVIRSLFGVPIDLEVAA